MEGAGLSRLVTAPSTTTTCSPASCTTPSPPDHQLIIHRYRRSFTSYELGGRSSMTSNCMLGTRPALRQLSLSPRRLAAFGPPSSAARPQLQRSGPELPKPPHLKLQLGLTG